MLNKLIFLLILLPTIATANPERLHGIPITSQELVSDTSAFSPPGEIKSLKYRHIPSDLISPDDKKSSVKNQLLRRDRYNYKINWNNVHIADLQVEIAADEIIAQIHSRGLAKKISKYKSHTHSTFRQSGENYIPIGFESTLIQRHGPKNVSIKYSKDGSIAKETVIPPDNRTKRPEVSKAAKIGAVNPLMAILIARDKILESLENDTKSFDFNIYDGRRLSRLEFNIYGKENIKILDKRQDIVKIGFRRVPLEGFTNNELKRMDGEEPDFVLYLKEDNLVPLKAEAKAPLGQAVFLLVE